MVPGLKSDSAPSSGVTEAQMHPSKAQPKAKGFTFTKPPTFDDVAVERQYLKERLAAAYRIFGKLGLCEGVAGHITVRDPEHRDCFWVTPFGKHFSLMTASDLLLVDHSGAIVGGGKPERQTYNQAAFVIHAAIHEARQEVQAVAHSHSTYGKAFSVLERELPMYTQDAAVFYKDHAVYKNFGGVVLDGSESARIVDALGNKKAILLSHHGILTVGKTIESATAWFIQMEQECHTTLLAESNLHGKPSEISDEAAEFTYSGIGTEEAGFFEATPYFDLIDVETNGAYKA